MAEFLTGIKEKYPAPLLKGRISCEGNVVACLMKDMLLIDDVNLNGKNFFTSDGLFYFTMLEKLRKAGYASLDEVTIMSSLNEKMIEGYEERGGWNSIQHLIDIINIDNFDTYLDNLYRENILVNLYNDGFNLLSEIDINGKKIVPLKLLRRMTAEEVLDWYEARMSTYAIAGNSKVTEEGMICLDEQFIQECSEGLDNGIGFETAGFDVNLEEINCFPFLSRQINGFMPGTLNILGGYSSVGKSTWWITVLMSMMSQGKKVLIITNEENKRKYEIKFFVWLLAKYERYYKLTKKKLMAGVITEEDKPHIKSVQEYWDNEYKDMCKVIAISDADMGVVKKKIRENVLREGYEVILYDTLKLDFNTATETRTDLDLVKNTRELDAMAKRYNIIILASLQLAIHSTGTLFLTSNQLSQSRQTKEVLESLFLMRVAYKEELVKNSKFYCNPYRLKKVNDKWVEEPQEVDETKTYRILFLDKTRSGSNSEDDGVAWLMSFDGSHALFRESYMCRPKHGRIE